MFIVSNWDHLAMHFLACIRWFSLRRCVFSFQIAAENGHVHLAMSQFCVIGEISNHHVSICFIILPCRFLSYMITKADSDCEIRFLERHVRNQPWAWGGGHGARGDLNAVALETAPLGDFLGFRNFKFQNLKFAKFCELLFYKLHEIQRILKFT